MIDSYKIIKEFVGFALQESSFVTDLGLIMEIPFIPTEKPHVKFEL